jgi:endonuclease YncB( thermonuclease family)
LHAADRQSVRPCCRHPESNQEFPLRFLDRALAGDKNGTVTAQRVGKVTGNPAKSALASRRGPVIDRKHNAGRLPTNEQPDKVRANPEVWEIAGGTFVVEAEDIRYRVRLAAVDSPEKDQPWGEASTRSLRRIVAGQSVRVDWHKQDQWKRLIGYVWVAPPDCPTCGYTLDAGMYQLTVGMAWHFKRYAKEQSPERRGQYEFAEYEARSKRVGL